MRTLFGLEGKNVVIVGGGQGMGEATARFLATLGCNLALIDVDLERAQRVATELASSAITTLPVQLDITDEQATITAIARVTAELGPIDGLATIVGMAGWSPILEMTGDTWDRDHRRNLRYFFVVAREVARGMVQRKSPGSIVAVASVDGIRSAPNHASYGAAKAGLINLVKSMAVEWADHSIRVNAVAPGGIVTPRLPVRDAESERASMSALPMKRRGVVDDIAKAIAFFLSDLSPYVTGQTLAVDGGYTATGVFKHQMSVPPQGTLGSSM